MKLHTSISVRLLLDLLCITPYIIFNLLSHVVPVHAEVQAHENVDPVFVQEPPFKQGDTSQGNPATTKHEFVTQMYKYKLKNIKNKLLYSPSKGINYSDPFLI